MKIIIINVKYSPNLGDGVIAECLEAAFSKACPEAAVSSCDLAGRKGYGEGLDASRRWVYHLLDTVPGALRRRLVVFMLRHLLESRLQAHYKQTLSGADVVVLGGGQLLADSDLNFPLKIEAAMATARAEGARAQVYAVGVARGWSRQGTDLFRSALTLSPGHVAVRDPASANNWLHHFGGQPVCIVDDPGLLAERTFGHEQKGGHERRRIGLGVANPSTLKLHANEDGVAQTNYLELFGDLARLISQAGYDTVLFTNGAADDEAFLAQIVARLSEGSGLPSSIAVAPKASTPRALCRFIGGLDGLVAHRLHANIVAFAYGVPCIGLGWDSKLKAFFESVDRAEDALSAAGLTPSTIVAALERALVNPVPAAERQRVIERCESSVQALASRMLPSNPSASSPA